MFASFIILHLNISDNNCKSEAIKFENGAPCSYSAVEQNSTYLLSAGGTQLLNFKGRTQPTLKVLLDTSLCLN